jgi:hypothetical protein
MEKNTKANGTLILSDGTTRTMEFNESHVTLSEMQACVGGYIELIHLKDGVILVVNEEGKLNNLKPNIIATELAGLTDDYIVGDVLLISSKFID